MGFLFTLFLIIVFLIILAYLTNHVFNGRCTISHDMSGKTIIITGSSSGLGKFSAIDLINNGAKVIFACRNEEKTKKVFNEIKEDKRHLAVFEKLDLSSFKSVIDFTNNIKSKYPKIDILMNNAGNIPYDYKETEDNFESCFESNYLSPVLLTFLLMDHLNENSKIINLASISHKGCSFNKEIAKKVFDKEYLKTYCNNVVNKNILYGITKLGIIYFTQEIADYLNNINSSIKIVCLHPGAVYTPIFNFYTDANSKLFTIFYKTLIFPLLALCYKTTEEGAQTQLFLSYLENNQIVSGKYYVDCKFGSVSSKTKDKELERYFFKETIEQISKKLPQYEKEFSKYVKIE